jgi:solute carrier family 25 oxoglutarate transporter 11
LTGAIGSAIANPIDMALIRFQSDNNLPPAERRNYKNVFDALGRIYSEEGITGLWRGSVPTIARAMTVNCSHLVGYNESKERLIKYSGEKKETMTIRLTASAISGVAVSLCALPFDNVKTKVLKMKKSN